MKKLSPYIAALLICAFILSGSAWGARETPAGTQDLQQVIADLERVKSDLEQVKSEHDTLKETVQRQLVDSPPNVPVGTILAYAGPADAPQNLPAGWRICNGDDVSRTEFAALFTKIGVSWGRGNGTTTFNLPDLRGRFLRGVDGGSGNDPDATGRTNRENQVVGGVVGSFQLDAMQSHKHLDSGHRHGTNATRPTGEVQSDNSDERAAPPNPPAAEVHEGKANLGNPEDSGTGAGAVRHGKENRPKNAYVNWIIRVK